VLHESRKVSAAQANRAMADFAQRRWKGQYPLLWGQSLRQALLDEHIYRTVLGLDRLDPVAHTVSIHVSGATDG
jgi:hypothetical protein